VQTVRIIFDEASCGCATSVTIPMGARAFLYDSIVRYLACTSSEGRATIKTLVVRADEV
jgi:hypothetical protein